MRGFSFFGEGGGCCEKGATSLVVGIWRGKKTPTRRSSSWIS